MIISEEEYDHEILYSRAGDLVVTVLLDAAVAAQIREVADRWGIDRIADAAADILLVGLMTVNSSASRQS